MERVQPVAKKRPGVEEVTSEPCPLRTAVAAIGGRWKPIVINYLLQRPYFFGELHRELEGISKKMLAAQLRELVRDGLVSRVVCEDARRSVRYAPTELGVTLQPVLDALVDWGNGRIRSIDHCTVTKA